MHNVEYKCELRDLELARTILRAKGASFVSTLEQVDTYYQSANGRLKRRETAGSPTEWIFYDRADRTRPKLSHYSVYTPEQAAERFPGGSLREWVVVSKTRDLFMMGSVRIHLDRVEGLGEFLEFEALVTPSQTVARCHEVLGELTAMLSPALGEAISCSYSDLIAAIRSEPGP